MTIKINEGNFESEVLKAEEPVFVAFYASWCRSQRMVAMLDRLSEELSGVAKVVRIDVEESPNLASQYDVSTVPSYAVLDHGTLKSRKSDIRAIAASVH